MLRGGWRDGLKGRKRPSAASDPRSYWTLPMDGDSSRI